MNSWPWLGWLTAALLIVSATRNPLYLFLVLLTLLIVFSFFNDPAGGENLAAGTYRGTAAGAFELFQGSPTQ